MTALVGALGALAGFLARFSLFRRRKIDTGAARLGQSNRDRLLCRSGAVLAFADVVHLLADELARLGGGGFAFALVASGAFEGFFFGHEGSFHMNACSATQVAQPLGCVSGISKHNWRRT